MATTTLQRREIFRKLPGRGGGRYHVIPSDQGWTVYDYVRGRQLEKFTTRAEADQLADQLGAARRKGRTATRAERRRGLR